jgi:NH3-dependent NAD+ synthetase
MKPIWLQHVQDPQDRGPGYRNVVGIPGGLDSELYQVFASKNVNNMKLVRSEGNRFVGGKATEDDAVNTVYIVDSTELPFHQAEIYHQYHNGIGKSFSKSYLVDMKDAKTKDGTIRNVAGCLEYPF